MALRSILVVLLGLFLGAGTARTEEPKAAKSHVLIPMLVAPPSDAPPVLDGKGGDPIWAAVQPVTVMAATASEAVPVEVRACLGEDRFVLRFTWPDAAADAIKGKSDTLRVVWAQRVMDDGTLEPALPREEDVQSFDASAPSGGGSVSGSWADGSWTVEVLRPRASEGLVPVAFTLSLSDPARGLAASGPVRLRPASSTARRDFEGDAAGQAAAGITSALAGKGKPPSWLVRADATRRSHVLVQEAQDLENDRYPLALLEGFEARDVDLSVRFQARKGFKDQAAGIVWRAKGAGDHYLLRANCLEQNVVLYKMQDNQRVDLPPVGRESDYGVEVKFDARSWHTLRAVAVGERFQAYLDGRLLFDVVDTTFPAKGGVGLWTKSDSVMAFDDVLAASLDPAVAK